MIKEILGFLNKWPQFDVTVWVFCLQNTAKITFRQVFLDEKLTDLYFWIASLLVLILQFSIVLGGNRKPYAQSLENWSDLPLNPPY